ncbi:uncharacterized protein K444DRAFT_76638 [Hyaloscypha bicolor E]|uniref:Uncharacterized protein n=1 Tax=Hyaloscypha bicolor E TaxID=1095630 RepID=A0A2J6SYA3_9HELO|nr:uncharacterized protein K444DRAFT_76638 [Hyaloscypha bicolor E]PMD55683.1 hypothetical protein K444DRAFT_76638 [Hyaloscypha bicolor E]
MTKNTISQPSKNLFVFVFGQEQQVQSLLMNFREDLRSCIYADSSTIFQSFLLNSGRRAVINNTKTIIEITRNVRKSLLAIMSLPWYEVLRVAQKPVNATLTAALRRTTKTNRNLERKQRNGKYQQLPQHEQHCHRFCPRGGNSTNLTPHWTGSSSDCIPVKLMASTWKL